MTVFEVKSPADSEFHRPDILDREVRGETEDGDWETRTKFEFGDKAQRCYAHQPKHCFDVLLTLLRNHEPVKEKVVKLHLQNVT